MLFTKEINQITYSDVVDFCNEQISESISLDYKKDFPTDLEKTIAAFANTMGGLIIIGVEDKDSKPKIPVEGLKYQKGFRERVNSIILSNVYPPIFPEIQVCEPVSDKTFLIIRIPQSNMTPHYIRHRTQTYIRTDDITKPEVLAPAEQIEWLRNRRKKSEELKEILYDSLLQRYNNYLKLYNFSGIQFAEATISSIPLYPSDPFKSPQEIKKISEEIKVRGYNRDFPSSNPHEIIKPVQRGVSKFFYNEENQFIYYTELNSHGLFLHKVDLGELEKVSTGKTGEDWKLEFKYLKRAYFLTIVELIDLFFEASANFYKRLGYWGILEFRFSLEKILGIKFLSEGHHQKQDNISVDNRLQWQREYYVNEIKNKRLELLMELLKDIGWSLGWDNITEERIKEVLKANHRL